MEKQKIDNRIKLSALWGSLMSLYIYADYFELYTPNKVQGFINGTNLLDTPTKLFSASLVLAVPALMIAMSILLKPKINKWLNIIFAALLSLVVVLVGSSSISEWYSFYVLYAILELIITLLILWYAWKWPMENSM